MKIAGIQKLTLVDFPGHVAATIFTQGCSFRCGFCHNPELVLPEKFEGLLTEREIFDFLEQRYGKLTGICLTGGEPLLQSDAGKFISHMKALGFDVKLDTNGSFPDRLKQIIKDGDVDYIAMDVKTKLSQYESIALSQKSKVKSQNENLKINNRTIEQSNNILSVISTHTEPTVGWTEEGEKSRHNDTKLIQNIQRSIKLIMSSGIDYEFRTTVCHPYHTVTDFEEIGKMIEGAKRYFIQNYQDSKRINESIEYTPFTDEELKEAKKIMKKYVEEVEVR